MSSTTVDKPKNILITEFKMRLRTKMFYTFNKQQKMFEKNFPWLDDTHENMNNIQKIMENYRVEFDERKNKCTSPCALVMFIEFSNGSKKIVCEKSINDVEELDFLVQTMDLCL